MKKINIIKGLVTPLDRANVDTDAIIPKQFLSSIERTGFGVHLFDEWRYLDNGVLGMDIAKRPLNHDFVFNHKRYQGASILLTQANFGCGSSREHAPWALIDHGISVIIAPSFADIFYSNCIKNGLLCIMLKQVEVAQLFESTLAQSGYSLTVDLPNQTIECPDKQKLTFYLENAHKHSLLHGLDEIGATLSTHKNSITDFEEKRHAKAPWLKHSVEHQNK